MSLKPTRLIFSIIVSFWVRYIGSPVFFEYRTLVDVVIVIRWLAAYIYRNKRFLTRASCRVPDIFVVASSILGLLLFYLSFKTFFYLFPSLKNKQLRLLSKTNKVSIFPVLSYFELVPLRHFWLVSPVFYQLWMENY